MSNFLTGSSNYPFNLDLLPTGVGTNPTISYVLDEIRDGNGVVIQSGTPITAIEMNSVYTIIDKLENVFGYKPEGSYTDVASRLNDMQFSGSNAFLHLSGGSITGFVDFLSGSVLNVTTLNGNALTMHLSGTTNIFGSGNINLTSTGNIAVTANNITATGISVIMQGTNLSLNGGSSSTLSAVSNQIVLSATGTSINKNIVPSSGASVDLGSTSSYINNIYVNNLIATGATIAGYVTQSGSVMSGNLKFTGNAGIVLQTGSNITNIGSGLNNLGDTNNPFAAVYTKVLAATTITGLSPITFVSDIRLGDGISIGASGTGITFGSATNPITTIYATSIVGATGLDPNGLVARSGSTMFGNLTMTGTSNIVLNSGSAILAGTSGNAVIGSTGSYMGNVYTNSINNRAVGTMIFNEMLTGTTLSGNNTFFLSHVPANNYAMIFVSGIYARPGLDYNFSGAAVIFTGSFAAPSTSPWAGFYVY